MDLTWVVDNICMGHLSSKMVQHWSYAMIFPMNMNLTFTVMFKYLYWVIYRTDIIVGNFGLGLVCSEIQPCLHRPVLEFIALSISFWGG